MQNSVNQRIRTRIVGENVISKKPTNCAVRSAQNCGILWAGAKKKKLRNR